MKHILNNLSEQEKNAIREQHTGGMKVVTENFNKLLGSKLGDSKPLVAEQNKFEFDPKDLEMPDLRDMFLSKNSTPEIEKMGEESKKAMHACVTENNLYKVKGFLDGIETKKMNLFNTIMANLFDRTMGGKSLGQEFNEFSDCMNKKMGDKLSAMRPLVKEQTSMIGKVASAITGQGKPAPQNQTGNDRISNLAAIMKSIQTKQVPQQVIVNPSSKVNGMPWNDYVTKFKITPQEMAQANALLVKMGQTNPLKGATTGGATGGATGGGRKLPTVAKPTQGGVPKSQLGPNRNGVVKPQAPTDTYNAPEGGM